MAVGCSFSSLRANAVRILSSAVWFFIAFPGCSVLIPDNQNLAFKAWVWTVRRGIDTFLQMK